MSLTVFREIANAQTDGIQRFIDRDFLSVQQHPARCFWIGTENEAGKFRASGADQSGQPQHFTRAHLERSGFDLATTEILYVEQDFSGFAVRLALIKIAQRSSDHHLDDFCRLQLLTRQFADVSPITQHRDAIGQGIDFGHAVTDVDDGDAFIAQFAHDGKQRIGFTVGKCGGRLIHDQDTSAMDQRPGDFNLLLLGDGELAGRCGGGKRCIKQTQDFLGATVHFGGIGNSPTGTWFAAHEHVFGHGQIGGY